MNEKYMILDAEHRLVATDDIHVWGTFFNDFTKRRVGSDYVGDTHISTVFIGIDHSFGSGPPLWFETMVFTPKDAPFEEETERYTTWDEAERGHAAMVERVRERVQEATR